MLPEDVKVLRPIKKMYSTDNAAMIGVVWILKKLGILNGKRKKI
jgi:tRNA A37 threonylcarbamoyltransferase TsaD